MNCKKLRWDTLGAVYNNVKERPYEWMIEHGYKILEWNPYPIADCVVITVEEIFYPLPSFLEEVE